MAKTETECCDICSNEITRFEVNECVMCHSIYCDECGADETCNTCVLDYNDSQISDLTPMQQNKELRKENLTIDHLAPYLPYGLHIKILNHKCDYVGIEYAEANGFYIMPDGLYLTYVGGSAGKSVNDFKPILRPLSSITDEQWLKIFNAGIEAAIMPWPDNLLNRRRFMVYHDSLGTECIITGSHSLHFDYENLAFETNGARFNQQKAFSALYELHSDIFNLIEKGLAIDINTL